MPPTAREIRAREPASRYVAYHAPRYARLLRVVDDIASESGVGSCLDIGRSLLTTLLAERLGAVDTLGFAPDGARDTGRHWSFDLNRSQRRETWRTDLPAYDLVVMSEVLEHLYTAPELVLSFVASLLTERGRLVVQTPNAAAWNKRLVLLAGRNPYDPISTDPRTPSHFREYTADEVAGHASKAGLAVERLIRESYFDHRFRPAGKRGDGMDPLGCAANLVGALCPPSMKRGMTFVLSRPPLSRPA